MPFAEPEIPTFGSCQFIPTSSATMRCCQIGLMLFTRYLEGARWEVNTNCLEANLHILSTGRGGVLNHSGHAVNQLVCFRPNLYQYWPEIIILSKNCSIKMMDFDGFHVCFLITSLLKNSIGWLAASLCCLVRQDSRPKEMFTRLPVINCKAGEEIWKHNKQK